jgi:hypothetical protein
MNKKLLSSSALVGAMLISGAALAEFKVGGDVTATVSFGSHDDSTTNKNQSDNRIGNETNITLSGSKDLANGLKATYAGKAEFDKQGTTPDHEYELKIGSGNMYVSFANDGGLTHRNHVTPFVSYPTSSSANAITQNPTAYSADSNLGVVATSNNIGIGGSVAGGNFVIRYAPNAGEGAGNDIAKISSDSTTVGSGMIAAYTGTFGNVGVSAAYTSVQKDDDNIAEEDDATEKRVGLSYNFGAAKVGIDHIRYEAGASTSADRTVTKAAGLANIDRDTTMMGVAYKVSDTVTVGAYYQETTDETTGSTQQDEEIKMLSIGYNLGGASVAVNIVDVEGNGLADAGAKDDSQGILITTKVGF